MNGLSLSLGMGLGGGGSVWSPASLGASLYAFWDAERTDLISQSAGVVSGWTDSAAESLALTNGGAPSGKPAWSATSFNGRPGVTFRKADQTFLNHAGLGSLPIGSEPCEIWILHDQTALVADTSLMVLMDYGNSSSAYRRVERTVAAGVNRAGARIGTGASASAASNLNADYSGRCVTHVRVGATATIVEVNGVAGSSATIAPATGTSAIIIGRSNSGGNPMDGIVNAVLVTAPLTGADEANTTAFLKARGGIA